MSEEKCHGCGTKLQSSGQDDCPLFCPDWNCPCLNLAAVPGGWIVKDGPAARHVDIFSGESFLIA